MTVTYRFIHENNTIRNNFKKYISPHQESFQPHVQFSIFYQHMGKISCATQYCAFCPTEVHRQSTRLRFQQQRGTLKSPIPVHSWSGILEQHPRTSWSRRVGRFLSSFSGSIIKTKKIVFENSQSYLLAKDVAENDSAEISSTL